MQVEWERAQAKKAPKGSRKRQPSILDQMKL